MYLIPEAICAAMWTNVPKERVGVPGGKREGGVSSEDMASAPDDPEEVEGK